MKNKNTLMIAIVTAALAAQVTAVYARTSTR